MSRPKANQFDRTRELYTIPAIDFYLLFRYDDSTQVSQVCALPSGSEESPYTAEQDAR